MFDYSSYLKYLFKYVILKVGFELYLIIKYIIIFIFLIRPTGNVT
jgi:hypothetical protein